MGDVSKSVHAGSVAGFPGMTGHEMSRLDHRHATLVLNPPHLLPMRWILLHLSG